MEVAGHTLLFHSLKKAVRDIRNVQHVKSSRSEPTSVAASGGFVEWRLKIIHGKRRTCKLERIYKIMGHHTLCTVICRGCGKISNSPVDDDNAKQPNTQDFQTSLPVNIILSLPPPSQCADLSS